MGLGSFFQRTIRRPLLGIGQERAAQGAADVQSQQFQQIADLYRPFAEFGQQQLPQLAASATPEGLGQNLLDLSESGALQPLIDERQRASQQALASTGLRRSGAAAREAANIPSSALLGIENLLSGRQQQAVNVGLGGVQGVSGALQGLGQSQASGMLGAEAGRQQGFQNLLNLGGSVASLFALSDVRLKENFADTGKRVGPFPIYSFDWSDEAKRLYGLEGGGVSWMAQDVERVHPDKVALDENGYLRVDYQSVLEAENARH